MLLELSVKNFRNFNDWVKFDLSTDRSYEFNTESLSDNGKIVRHGIIYGLNGSGKSNVGLALLDLTCHLTDNFVLPSLKSNYLNAQSKCNLAEFVYKFQLNGSILEYRYGKSDYVTLEYETLLINGEICIELDRRNSDLATFTLPGAENLKNNFATSKISAVKYLHANALLEQDEKTKVFEQFMSFVDGMVFFRTLHRSSEHTGQTMDAKRISHAIIEANKIEHFEAFLNRAGVECKLNVAGAVGEEFIVFSFEGRDIEFSLAASTGTLSLGIFYYWWMKLQSGQLSFAFIDEFDAYYHFELSKLIVKMISTTKCQTLLTTHNTAIMSNELLRPDCYFELKDKKINSLPALTDRELRKAHNLEKMWRSGALSD